MTKHKTKSNRRGDKFPDKSYGLMAQLRESRIAQGISQDELAERLGWTLNTVQNVEYGKTTPNLEKLVRMAWHLGFKVRISIEPKDKNAIPESP